MSIDISSGSDIDSSEEETEEVVVKLATEKKSYDPRFMTPTRSELNHLRQTENLFKSNMMQLEVMAVFVISLKYVHHSSL